MPTFIRALSPQFPSQPSPSINLTGIAFCPNTVLTFLLYLSIHPSITWLRQFDNQSQPRRAFPAIILPPGLPSPIPSNTSTKTLAPFSLAASPPGAARGLHLSLPVRTMPVYPMVLRPPPLLRPHLSPLLVLQRRRLARIIRPSFRISLVSLSV